LAFVDKRSPTIHVIPRKTCPDYSSTSADWLKFSPTVGRDAAGRAVTKRRGPLGPRRGKPVKFTPEAIEKINVLVAQGVGRQEIANLLGVTVGSLQVTCSRFGISLRRNILHSGTTPHLRDPNGRAIPPQGSVGVAYARETEEVSQKIVANGAASTKFSITMRYRGKEISSDLPLTSGTISELALIATLRHLSMAELVGQVLAGAIEKDMIKQILQGGVPASSGAL
jgi:hypothetical protein